MKRLIIICEGQTEVEFCKSVLYNHFFNKNIIIQTPLIKKSGGGIVPWKDLKIEIQNHLLEKGVFVTTFIDYYGIPDNYNFPKWEEAKKIHNKNQRIDLLENEMKKDVNHPNFIPYIQLHEFEGLLFNNINVFDNNFKPSEMTSRQDLLSVINNFPNPELINNGVQTAPSKRLQRLISGYSKVFYGSMLAEEIGLNNIRRKSPRFNKWIDILERI